MSDNAIRVGDLVVVVKRHCDPSRLGYIFVVQQIQLGTTSRCSRCGSGVSAARMVRVEFDPSDGKWWAYPDTWLRRIPPLWELDEAERKEEEKV